MSCSSTNGSGNEYSADQEEILALGIVHTSTDGTSVTIDNSRVARSYREASLRDVGAIACGRVRPPFVTAVQRFQ